MTSSFHEHLRLELVRFLSPVELGDQLEGELERRPGSAGRRHVAVDDDVAALDERAAERVQERRRGIACEASCFLWGAGSLETHMWRVRRGGPSP